MPDLIRRRRASFTFGLFASARRRLSHARTEPPGGLRSDRSGMRRGSGRRRRPAGFRRIAVVISAIAASSAWSADDDGYFAIGAVGSRLPGGARRRRSRRPRPLSRIGCRMPRSGSTPQAHHVCGRNSGAHRSSSMREMAAQRMGSAPPRGRGRAKIRRGPRFRFSEPDARFLSPPLPPGGLGSRCVVCGAECGDAGRRSEVLGERPVSTRRVIDASAGSSDPNSRPCRNNRS